MRYAVLMLLIPLLSAGQKPLPCPSAAHPKAVSFLEKAYSARKSQKKYSQVLHWAQKATAMDSTYAKAWKFIGDIAYFHRDYKTMEQAYRHFIALCPEVSPEPYYRLGVHFYNLNRLEECQFYLLTFLQWEGQVKEEQLHKARQLLNKTRLQSQPVPFNPVPLREVSTPDPEYLAVISADNELCFFTRRFEVISKDALTPLNVEKFMIARRKADGNFDRGEPMPLPFNSRHTGNEGAPSITIDNLTLYFTINQGGNFDICYSQRLKDGWGPIINVGPEVNDPKQWDSQPSISADGKTLYFVSFRDSVHLTSDIFISRKLNGRWSRAEPLSRVINTTGNEKSPFIHPDGRTLYFSSDTHPGMGGFDIFVSRRDDQGNWSRPVNLGYPINTEADEVGFFVSTDGRTGYFASNTLHVGTGYDIYAFEIPEQVRPERVLMVSGVLLDERKEVPRLAKIELKNITTNAITDVDYDTLTGRYASVVPFKDDYLLTIKRDNAAFISTYFSRDDTANYAPVKMDFELKKIELGVSYTLPDILFPIDSYELSLASKRIVAEFKEFLLRHPKLKVAIHGHTDNSGTPEKNMILSQERARAVYHFLISLGISPSRLSYRGFGQTRPIDTNDTPEGRSRNRRTEFVIISK